MAAEIALALSILIGGGLLVRSLHSIVNRDLGFEPEGVVVAEVHLTAPEYQTRDGQAALRYWDSLLERLTATPGIETASVANWIPTGIGGRGFLAFPDNPDPDFGAGYRVVSDGYFRAMGMAIVQGRSFEAIDESTGARVAVVNRAMAERAWPGQSAIGQLIRSPSMEDWMYAPDDSPWLTVVGVVGDVRHDGFESEVQPELYTLYRQVPARIRGMHVVVRGTDGGQTGIAAAVRTAVQRSDASLAVEVEGLAERVGDLLRERVVTLWILVGFSITAVFLTCLGIYGLVAHAASLRTREMAVRAALGAQASGLLRLTLVGAARVILIGTVAGLGLSWILSRLVESLVVDVTTKDPVTFVSATLLLALVGFGAALLPSVQASRLDPSDALRAE